VTRSVQTLAAENVTRFLCQHSPPCLNELWMKYTV